jgi:hypothetical protein
MPLVEKPEAMQIVHLALAGASDAKEFLAVKAGFGSPLSLHDAQVAAR